MNENVLKKICLNDKNYILVYTEIHDGIFDATLNRNYYFLDEGELSFIEQGCLLDEENHILVNPRNGEIKELKSFHFNGMGCDLPIDFLDDIEIETYKFIKTK